MLFFWVCLIFLTVVALLILSWPLLFSSARLTPLHRAKTNIHIYEENLQQLTQDFSQQKITQKQFKENQLTLKKNLLEDIPELPPPPIRESAVERTKNWKTFLFLTIALPLFSIIFYLYNGNSQLLSKTFTAQKEAAEIIAVRKSLGKPQHVIETLQQHLAKNPNSAEGWYLLGRLYFTQQEYSKSVNAFEKAYTLNKKNPDILFQYAQALYLTEHSLNGKPAALLKQLLALQPTNALAINLLAVAAFNEKHYQHAILYWEKLLPYYSPESADGKALLDAIARANHKIRKNL